MAKKYLHSIELQNFKAFPNYENLVFDGKHTIVWGVNGSGKSSVFWGLYTFLQCNAKPENDYKKYFDGGNQDLKNIFGGGAPAYLKLSFAEKDDKGVVDPNSIETYALKHDDDSDTRKEQIGEYYLGSEFISHRLLLNFSNFRNSEDLNLWPYFERDILPYFNYKGKNLFDLLKEFKTKLNTESKKELDQMKEDFNNGLQDLIQPLVKKDSGKTFNILTEFYADHLAEKNEFSELKIFNPTLLDFTGNKNKRLPILPKILLKARFGPSRTELKEIPKPHVFYNEARINGIALAIRFVLMENRMRPDRNNLLCLDDLLISLDMHNRKRVIDLLLSKYSENYQLLLFTHEKGFFNEFLRAVKKEEKNWKALILRETKIDQNPKVEEKGIQTYYDRAEEYFNQGEYEAAGLFLRKEAERVLAQVFDPSLDFVWRSELMLTLGDYIGRARGDDKQAVSNLKIAVLGSEISDAQVGKAFDDFTATLGDSIEERKTKSQLSKLKGSILKFRENVQTKDKLKTVLDKIDTERARTLNPSAHFNETPLFKEEMEEALKTLKDLKALVGA